MKTKFALDSILVKCKDKNLEFWFDGNSKITGNAGTFENPKPNAFSLVQIEDCPEATPLCKSVCYVSNLEKEKKEIHNKYRINSTNIRLALDNPEDTKTVAWHFSQWIKDNVEDMFRWHVSGDIICNEYAEFIAEVCRLTPDTNFWIYTRSFSMVKSLYNIPNLAVNLSVDKDNYNEAIDIHNKYGFRMCYLTMDGTLPPLPPGSVIFPSHELRGRDLDVPTDAPWWKTLTHEQQKMTCVADFFGQSENYRCGPCRKCF